MSSTIKQAIQALKSRIADAYTAVSNKGGTLPATQDSANLPTAIASIPSGGDYSIDGCVWESGYEPQNSSDAMINYHKHLLKVNDTGGIFTNLDDAFFRNSNLQEFVSYATTRIGVSVFYSTNTILRIVIPNCLKLGGEITSSSALKEVNLLNAMLQYVTNPYFTPCVNLIDLTIGAGITGNLSLVRWSPTNALNASSSSLVEPGETFANNLEKLLYNIREHIAANLPDRTGLSSFTLTMSAAVKAAIQADTATSNAFTNKNWTIA